MVAATLFGLYVGAVAGVEKGSGSIATMLAGVTWLGVFVIAVPSAGFIFTLAWPLMRHAGAKGWPISLLLGGVGGFGIMWANHAMVGKSCTAGELEAAALLGIVVGGAYWWIAQRD
jgi:hypothetical protein